jgi:hypothetical protein
MNALFALFNPARWLLLLAAVAALGVGYLAWADHIGNVREEKVVARYEKQIKLQKAQAILDLATETAKTQTAERGLVKFKNQREITDAKNRTTVAGLERRLRDAAGAAGRLRDPNQAGCGSGSGSTPDPVAASPSDRAGNPAEAGGLFSAGATELLQRLTREADEINMAYSSCRADALSLRMTLPP